MSTPTVDKFLSEIARILLENNGSQLQDFLIIEPPLPPLYNQIVGELRQAYPNSSSHEALETNCKSFIQEYPEGGEGGSRSAFILFLTKYFAFIRDVNVENLVETHDMLKALLKLVSVIVGVVKMLMFPQPVHSCSEFVHGSNYSPDSNIYVSNPR